jgi:drug/metabolite transporter (DMT)-like permease
MLGAAVALFSALCFSLSDVFTRRGVVVAQPSYGAFVTVLMGVPLFALAALFSGQLLDYAELPGKGYLLMAAAGLVHYVVGRYFNYAAVQAIGAARSSPVQSLTLPYSVVVALVLLDEGITTGMAIGMGLILVGPAIMVERQKPRAPIVAAETALEPTLDGEPLPPAPPQFELRQAEGYAFAFIAAISYGSSPVLIRAALEDTHGLAIFGGFISYVAAAGFLLATVVLPPRRHMLQALQPKVVRAFFGAGAFVFLAQMLRFIALGLASVATVATLLRFAGIFTLLFSWLFNRDLERITWRLVLGVVLSVAGAVLMVVTAAG